MSSTCDIVYLLKNNWLCFENINDCIIKLIKGRATSFEYLMPNTSQFFK